MKYIIIVLFMVGTNISKAQNLPAVNFSICLVRYLEQNQRCAAHPDKELRRMMEFNAFAKIQAKGEFACSIPVVKMRRLTPRLKWDDKPIGVLKITRLRLNSGITCELFGSISCFGHDDYMRRRPERSQYGWYNPFFKWYNCKYYH